MEKVKKFGSSLKAPFRRKKSRSPSPSPSPTSVPRPASSSTPANAPSTTVPSNVISGSSTVASSSIAAGPAPATTNPSPKPQSPPVSVPVKSEAFQKAMQDYINNLSDDDKKAFQSATDVMEKLRELQQSRSRISSSHTTRVQKVLQCIQRFLGSVSICIQHHPDISSLVVGGLNCILILALGYIEFFESLTDMMERIGNHLSYLSECSSIAFQNSEKIQETLVDVYRDLMDFYIKVRGIFSNKEGKASYLQGFKLFLRVTWEPFEEQFKSIESHFLENAGIIVRLVIVHSANMEHQYHAYMKDLQERQEDERYYEERRKLLMWLSPDDFEQTHEKHLKKRFQKTGQWLLDDPRFMSWRDKAQSSLLWCHGAPGSGKTVIASLVTDHLSALYELSTDTGVTFIYCNYMESRSSAEYIKLAIKQICRRMKHLPHQLLETYKKHYNNASQPSSEELKSIFLTIALQFNSMFLVLDALDECTLEQRAELCKFFSDIIEPNTTSSSPSPGGQKLASTTRGIVKLFVTSRKEPDIERIFLQKSFPKIEIEAAKVDSDIAVYTQAQIECRLQDHRLILQNMALKSKILIALTTKAGGMFLWVEFQLDSICAQVSDDAIEKALESVPEDMDATYERILSMINKKPRSQRELARKVLICIAYARSPLPISILAYAVSINKDTKSLQALGSSIPPESTILSACSNLVSIDKNTQKVQFVHFSVQEFLTGGRSQATFTHEEAHRELARMLITLLSIMNRRSLDACNEGTLLLNTLNNWPFHVLAANLKLLSEDDPLITLISSFLEKSPPIFIEINNYGLSVYLRFSPSVLELIFNLPSGHQHYRTRLKTFSDDDLKELYAINGGFSIIFYDHFAIHYVASVLDSVPAARRLCTHGYRIDYFYSEADDQVSVLRERGIRANRILVPDEVPTRYDYTPLYSAISEEMAWFLLEQGASVDPHHMGGSSDSVDPLLFFALKGSAKITQLLLDQIVDRERCGTVLCHVLGTSSCNVEVVQQLLDKGADVNTQGGEYGNPLQAAACRGKLDMVQLLLDEGADINTHGGQYGNALQAAADCGKLTMVQLLLDRGADINAQGGRYGNALQAAAHHGKLEVVQLLLDKGADICAQGGRFGNTLQSAAYRGQPEMVRLLLDKGADINAQGGEYGTALQAAACCNKLEVVQLLLDNGADANAQGGGYGNPLQAAAFFGGLEMVQLLLDKGADVNAQGGNYGQALQAAAHWGEPRVVQLLLDKGADVNARGGEHGSALQAAICGNSLDVVRLILDHGGDVNAPSGEHGNALQAAVCRNNLEMVQLILDKGADINAQSGDHGSALQAAICRNNLEMVQLLLEQGADVNAQGGEYGNTLQAAVCCSGIEVVEILLNKGADVNARDGKHGTALQAALAPLGRRYNCKAVIGPSISPNPITVQHNEDIFPLVEHLLDHGADPTIGDILTAAKELWTHDPDILADFMKRLEINSGREEENELAI